MLGDVRRNRQLPQLLHGHLFGVGAQDQMNLVRSGINLLEQTLQINAATHSGRTDYQFHYRPNYTNFVSYLTAAEMERSIELSQHDPFPFQRITAEIDQQTESEFRSSEIIQ